MFTPGPWVITKHNGRIEIRQNGDEWSSMIAHIYSSGTVNGNFYKMPSMENANLIATAPELLTALEDLFEFCKNELQESPMVYLEVESTIAKAKGIK